MSTPLIDQSSPVQTRRAIIRTGAKLLYAAPLVAATTSLSGRASAISGECTAGANCSQDFEPTCGESQTCECAQTMSHGIACVATACTDIACSTDEECESGICITVPGCCGNVSFCGVLCPEHNDELFTSSTQTRGWRQ